MPAQLHLPQAAADVPQLCAGSCCLPRSALSLALSVFCVAGGPLGLNLWLNLALLLMRVWAWLANSRATEWAAAVKNSDILSVFRLPLTLASCHLPQRCLLTAQIFSLTREGLSGQQAACLIAKSDQLV